MMLAPGDRVAVFTGRDYTTVANHGIVLVPGGDSQSRTLVFLPHLNSYCLADDESLLQFEHGETRRVPFAEIVFAGSTPDHCFGTYQRLGESKNFFEFIRSSDGDFGFDIRAEIANNGVGIGKTQLEIRIPDNVKMEIAGCINILRQILNVQYSKNINPKPENAE